MEERQNLLDMSKYVVVLKDWEGNNYDFRIWQVMTNDYHKILLGEFFEHSDALLFAKARHDLDEELSKILEEGDAKYGSVFKKLAEN